MFISMILSSDNLGFVFSAMVLASPQRAFAHLSDKNVTKDG
jgi:DMSO reductase anchor subunit